MRRDAPGRFSDLSVLKAPSGPKGNDPAGAVWNVREQPYGVVTRLLANPELQAAHSDPFDKIR